MKKIIILVHILLCFSVANAQTFVTKGKIEFERKVNVHANMGNNSWTQAMKKNIPQFKTSYFDLYFDGDKTLYKPGREVQEMVKIPEWFLGPANDNSVFTDLNKQMTVSSKTIVDATYLLTDSTRKLDWKITNDTRTIAGIECRRATTIIMDSVFVVAFYTDQILTSGGPESMNGLPGMILGLAIPRLHTTWYATKLQLVEVKESDLAAPAKGKKMNKNELSSKLAAVMKDWGGEDEGRQIWNWQVLL